MNKDAFISAVRNPNNIPLDINAIVQAFPYFQSARMLSAKSSKTEENHQSDSFLRNAAAFSVDRTRLFLLLNEKNIESTNFKSIQEDSNVTENESESETTQHSILENQISEVLESQNLVLEEEIVPSKVSEETKNYEELSSLMKEVLANLEALKATKKLAAESFEQVLNEPVLPVSKLLIPSIPQNIKLKSTFKVNSFVTPIDYKNQELQDGRLGETTGTGSQLDILQNYLQYLNKRKNPVVEDQMAVIESFIKRNPSISKPTEAALAMNKADFAQQSTKETNELVTENLANIFIKQKKYSKAIEIYQKLNLKYPEKSTYFAQKITELQNL